MVTPLGVKYIDYIGAGNGLLPVQGNAVIWTTLPDS